MSTLVIAITLFVFALLIGVIVIGKVPATLHTPLMSGANSVLALALIFFAAALGTANVVGGYTVTDRMLEMFKSKNKPEGK